MTIALSHYDNKTDDDEINTMLDDLLSEKVEAPTPVRGFPAPAVDSPAPAPTTAAVVTGTAAPVLLHKYPMTTKIDGISQEALVKKLTQLTESYRKSNDYYAIRIKYLAISMALNKKGLLAPAFRQNQPRIPPLKLKHMYGQLRIQQLLIDQIVIDCHWLHCRKEFVVPKWQTLWDLFNPDLEFNAELISINVGKHKWKREFRADDMLVLTPYQQNQLLILRNLSIFNAYKEIFEGDVAADGKSRVPARITPIRRTIRSWAEKVHQIRGHQEVYEALWAAREMLGIKAPKLQLVKLAGYIVGRPPLDRTTIRSKYKSLDNMLEGVGLTKTKVILYPDGKPVG